MLVSSALFFAVSNGVHAPPVLKVSLYKRVVIVLCVDKVENKENTGVGRPEKAFIKPRKSPVKILEENTKELEGRGKPTEKIGKP